MPLSSIRSDDYEAFRLFLEEACGILLGKDKHYLVQSRLGKLVREDGGGNLANWWENCAGNVRVAYCASALSKP